MIMLHVNDVTLCSYNMARSRHDDMLQHPGISLTAKRPDLTPQSVFPQCRCLAAQNNWPDAIRAFERAEARCQQYACQPIVELPIGSASPTRCSKLAAIAHAPSGCCARRRADLVAKKTDHAPR